ncbi:MAG TPA: hypothetical protein VE954_43305 [Oligoflexus sp.]|uniref:hypothetical protein n=1 Tax=Oligoflexus sp. TaxID=1971216 RepID=UPI002D27E20B|nr:hypothetical protein [Oligoflexus sp.]HYX39973.1 hypothetical protein [Oligoflexus sp.]
MKDENIRFVSMELDGELLAKSLGGLLDLAVAIEEKADIKDTIYRGPHPHFVIIALSMTLKSLVDHGMYSEKDMNAIIDEVRINLSAKGPTRVPS